MVTPPETTLPFLSHELKEGDPSCKWRDFKDPKLRKFPKPASSLRVSNFIGAGEDGLVLRARTDDGKEVAVKIFYHNEQPHDRYWAFERECCNCAVLDMISTNLRDRVLDDNPLLLHPRPKTREASIRNLRAFSTEYAEKYRANHPPDFERFNPHVHINSCLGWMQLDGHEVWSLLRKIKAGPCPGLTQLSWYFAIVYMFVPEGLLEEDMVQSSLDFFYLAGFVCVLVKLDNWRGSGILVDFSDLILPHSPAWRQFYYGKMVKKESGRFDLEYPNRKEDGGSKTTPGGS